jgi:hypothetical protein
MIDNGRFTPEVDETSFLCGLVETDLADDAYETKNDEPASD